MSRFSSPIYIRQIRKKPSIIPAIKAQSSQKIIWQQQQRFYSSQEEQYKNLSKNQMRLQEQKNKHINCQPQLKFNQLEPESQNNQLQQEHQNSQYDQQEQFSQEQEESDSINEQQINLNHINHVNQKKQESQQCQSKVQSHQMKSYDQRKKRKIRTTITIQTLRQMNKVFQAYRKNPHGEIKLKQISERLGLGYSTVLHKYKQYKKTNLVLGGALIQSKFHKRKYQKSLQIQSHISSALRTGSFFTANQLSSFIKQNYQKDYSRSIISRHLGQMGYSYKNVKGGIDGVDEEQARDRKVIIVDGKVAKMTKEEMFAMGIGKVMDRGEAVLWLHEVHFLVQKQDTIKVEGKKGKSHSQKYNVKRINLCDHKNNSQLITLLFVANKNQITFYRFQTGKYNRSFFYKGMQQILNKLQLHQNPQVIAPQSPSQQFQLSPSQQVLFSSSHNQLPPLKSSTPSTPSFLLLSFQQHHKDYPENQEKIWELLRREEIVLMYMVGDRFSMLEMWTQRYLDGVGDKIYKGNMEFVQEVQRILQQHAYDVGQFYQSIRNHAKQLTLQYQSRQKQSIKQSISD